MYACLCGMPHLGTAVHHHIRQIAEQEIGRPSMYEEKRSMIFTYTSLMILLFPSLLPPGMFQVGVYSAPRGLNNVGNSKPTDRWCTGLDTSAVLTFSYSDLRKRKNNHSILRVRDFSQDVRCQRRFSPFIAGQTQWT